METHYLLFLLFTLGWGVFLIGETARYAGDAKSACDNYEDLKSDSLEKYCNGVAFGAVFSIFGAAFSLLAAALSQKDSARLILFLISLFLFTLGRMSRDGGYSAASCDSDVDDKTMCQGYGAASAFFFFASISALVLIVLHLKFGLLRFIFAAGSFVYLGLFAIGLIAEYSTQADVYCTADEDDLVPDTTIEANEKRCAGYGFAAVMAAVAFLLAVGFGAVAFVKRGDSTLILGWFFWVVAIMLAAASSNGAEGQIYCEVLDQEDYQDSFCKGYSAAAVFYVFSLLVAIIGAICVLRRDAKMQMLFFFAAWLLFYLGQASYAGGQADGYCTLEDDSKGKGYAIDVYKNTCDGYSAATVFYIIAFVVSTVAMVLARSKTEEDSGPSVPSKGDPGSVHDVRVPYAAANSGADV